MRYHLQRVGTREWLSRDFDLAEGVTTRALSGPGGVSGNIAPELRFQRAPDGLRYLEKWGTLIYAEDGGLIRGGGIVTEVEYEGEHLILEAPGFTSYPAEMPYASAWPAADDPEYPGVQIDPMAAFRHIWAHLQSFPDGDLGLVVDNVKTPVRIGTNAERYRLRWWDNVDCGGELDTLASNTPFDYTEEHRWADADKSDVTHRLRIGYPRLGRRRTDLRFVEGENITVTPSVSDSGEEFANEWIGIGKGEGSRMKYARAAARDGRLRRARVVTDKTADQERIDTIVGAQMRKSLEVEDIAGLEMIDHPNARIAAIDPGDEILADVDSPHLGRVRIWLRVTEIAEAANGYTASLATTRVTAFSYSPTVEAG